jgi:hypothetical protein
LQWFWYFLRSSKWCFWPSAKGSLSAPPRAASFCVDAIAFRILALFVPLFMLLLAVVVRVQAYRYWARPCASRSVFCANLFNQLLFIWLWLPIPSKFRFLLLFAAAWLRKKFEWTDKKIDGQLLLYGCSYLSLLNASHHVCKCHVLRKAMEYRGNIYKSR